MHEGLLHVVIREHTLAMRTTDYKLDATAILNTAGLNGTPSPEVPKNSPETLWIHDGWKSLIGAVSRRRISLPGIGACRGHAGGILTSWLESSTWTKELFFVPRWSCSFAKMEDIIPSVQTVNARHLARLGNNIYRDKLYNFFKKFKISKMLSHGGEHQGSYINYEDARKLCRHFLLSEDPINEIMALIPAEPGNGSNMECRNANYPELNHESSLFKSFLVPSDFSQLRNEQYNL